MAYWRATRKEVKEILNTLGDGENIGAPAFKIKDTQGTKVYNLDSKDYPDVCTRPGRSTYAPTLSTNVLGLGQRNNNQIHVVDNNTWKYWTIGTSTDWTALTTTLSTNASAEFQDFVTGTERLTILFNSTQALAWDGATTSVPFAYTDTNIPFTNRFVTHKGRVYALTDKDIKYCALNKTTDWTTSQDAGQVNVTRAKGQLVADCEFKDKVITFTEYSMHELYGTGPDTFELIDIEGDIGCIAKRSIVKSNSRLYWLWFDGIYEYDGSNTVRVSDPMKPYIKGITYANRGLACAGAIGQFIYFSIPYGTTTKNNMVLKFDSVNRTWFQENGGFSDYVTIQNTLYGVDYDGRIWNVRDESSKNDAGTPIDWEFISKPYNDNSIAEKKTMQELYIVATQSTDSTSMAVSYSTSATGNESTNFTDLATAFTASTNPQNTQIIIPLTDLQNVEWYRLRVKGTGPVSIHYLQKNLRIRSR